MQGNWSCVPFGVPILSHEPISAMTSTAIVNKVWNFCHTLRDDGVGYGDYLEQLTYLLFLKMADECSKPPYNRDTHIPKNFNWESLRGKSGAELESHYVKLLDELGKKTGMLGDIFVKSQNKITDPAKLHKLIQLIDGESWVLLGADVKGDIYEGLLQKNAEDTKSGAGQYLTPRALIQAMVECVRRLPTGIFYAQGVKANVLFFENKPASKTAHTKDVWINDYRTNIKHTLKTNPLAFDDLKNFMACDNPADRHKRKATWSEKSPEGRWRKYTYAEIIARDKASLDIFWLKDDSLEDSANLPEPGVLAAAIVEDLEAALEQFRMTAGDLK